MHPLDCLYKPKSIAVIGASANEEKAGYQIVYALRTFPGKLYPINPRADTILGFKAYPRLRAIGSPVDLAILSIPAQNCLDALQEAGETGVGAALIIGGGFAEAGGEGLIMQNEIASLCRRYNIQLLGPNTAGFTNPQAGITANFVPWIGEISAGDIGIVSQSGAMSFCLSALVQALDMGVSLITGIGNGAVVDISDVVDYLGDDEDTKVIVLYLEGLKEGEGRRLYDAVKKVTAKKPIVFLTIGQTDVSEFATSHTGNLIGSYKLKVAALTQAGAVPAESCDDAIDAASLLARARLQPQENPGVGLLTGQAGPGLVIADYLRSRGVLVPEFHPSTIARIKEILPPISFIKNPVDTTRQINSFPGILRAMAEDPSIDILTVFALHEPALLDPVGLFEQFQDVHQPLIFGTSGFPEHINPTRRLLADSNVAAFPSPDRTAKAIRALVDDAKTAYRRQNTPNLHPPDIEAKPLEETPDEAEALNILEQLGIPAPRRAVCSTPEEALAAFTRLPKPCVVKVLDKSIQHKTEVGGVILDIETEKQLLAALARIDGINTDTNIKYLLEETARQGLELIIGAVRDLNFGPTVLLGLGGTTAEALGDVSMRLAPVSTGDAKEMIGELQGKELLDGWRGSPTLDQEVLVETLIKIGNLLISRPEIKEIEINPARLYEKGRGLMALDALIVLR